MQVVNLKTWKGAHIYCGRPSPLGNPFHIGRDGDRQEVIEKYRRWLWEKIKTNDAAVVDSIRSLKPDSVLGCWCHPLPCHCDIIIRAWEYLQK